MIDSGIKIECKGGGSFTHSAPVFSSDGSIVFVCWKNVILSYNTKTGKRLLEYCGMVDTLVGLSVHYFDNCECITACSKTGEVATWKIETAFKLLQKRISRRTIQIKTFDIVPVSAKDKGKSRKALLSWVSNKLTKFGIINLKNGQCELINFQLDDTDYKVDGGANNTFAVIQANKLYFISFQVSGILEHSIGSQLHFTCIACHPTEDCVITGDSLGRVIMWHNLSYPQPTQTIYHWHTLPVKCVSFSTLGSFFYSGGDECVLVKWEEHNSLKKSFLPRLPGTIEHVVVSENNLFVAVTTSDSGIRILDSQLDVVSVIQWMVLTQNEMTNMVFDGRTKALVMNGTIGHVQFYSPYNMNLLYSLDVVGRNKITQERNCKIENVDVTKIAISKSGLWMATVEERKDGAAVVEIRLKFLVFNQVKQAFHLNTSIEYPHDEHISDIKFEPREADEELRCVTVGNDKKFKIWQLEEYETVDNKDHTWKCTSVVIYKDLPANALSFSSDGSLLSVGFDNTVTVWLPESSELKCSLLHPMRREPIKFLQFGMGTSCHLLVSATAASVSVWDLLTLCMTWTVPVRVSLLVADTLTAFMAVFSEDSKLFVFSPANSKPVYTSEKIVASDLTVKNAVFVPSLFVNDTNLNWCQRSHLYYLTSDQELYSICTKDEVTESTPLLPEIEVSNSLYSLIQPKIRASGVTSDAPVKHAYTNEQNKNALSKLLDAPIHTMPPVSLTCEAILRSMVLEKCTEVDSQGPEL